MRIEEGDTFWLDKAIYSNAERLFYEKNFTEPSVSSFFPQSRYTKRARGIHIDFTIEIVNSDEINFALKTVFS